MPDQVEAMKAVVDAARTLRRIAGLANKHRANCLTRQCKTCCALPDMEADLAMDLDVRLIELDKAHG